MQLAALFLDEDSFQLIDEPTNHLDARSRSLVAAYLKRKRGFILVCHDRQVLDACTDHIMALGRDGIEICRGSYSAWLENVQRRQNDEEVQNEQLKRTSAGCVKLPGGHQAGPIRWKRASAARQTKGMSAIKPPR